MRRGLSAPGAPATDTGGDVAEVLRGGGLPRRKKTRDLMRSLKNGELSHHVSALKKNVLFNTEYCRLWQAENGMHQEEPDAT